MTNEILYKSAAGYQRVMSIYDSILENWPIPYDTCTLETRHGPTFVIRCGDVNGKPLILLHGAGTNSATWVEDVAAYGDRYRIYAVDIIGEAGKSAPNRPPWEGPAFAEWLADVMDGLQVQQAALLGISQGGFVALKFATHYPDRVSHLILLAPGGVVRDKLSFMLRVIPLVFLGRWGARRMQHIIFGSAPVSREAEEAFLVLMEQFKPRVGTLPIFNDDELQRLTMPALLISGTEDVIRDAGKIARRLEAQMPQLRSVILPGVGHVLLNVTPHVNQFLDATT